MSHEVHPNLFFWWEIVTPPSWLVSVLKDPYPVRTIWQKHKALSHMHVLQSQIPSVWRKRRRRITSTIIEVDFKWILLLNTVGFLFCKRWGWVDHLEVGGVGKSWTNTPPSPCLFLHTRIMFCWIFGRNIYVKPGQSSVLILVFGLMFSTWPLLYL